MQALVHMKKIMKVLMGKSIDDDDDNNDDDNDDDQHCL